MNILKGIVTELRDRRLWPVAVVLLVGLIAVPVLLAKSPATIPALAPRAGTAVASTHGVSVKLQASPVQANLTGKARNPFPSDDTTTPGKVSVPSPSTAGGASSGTTASTASTASSSTGSGSDTGSGSGSSGASSSSSSSSSTPPASSSTPTAPAKSSPSQPSGLTGTESYRVALEISNGTTGGVEPIDPLVRDSAVPSDSQPLLIELGVQKGGTHVMFAVEPGAVFSGPSSCVPGPIDCELVSVPVGALETVTGSNSTEGATFSVTAITVVHHPSVAAAEAARNTVDAAGEKLLESSSQQALSLFKFEPSVGAVVDLRNLTVGGN